MRTCGRLQVLCVMLCVCSAIYAIPVRIIENIDLGWYFNPKGDSTLASVDDSGYKVWERVDLPHDYSITQAYSKGNRRENGFLPGGGIVWYKRELEWKQEWEGKQVYVEFDGAYMNSTVWLNGHKLGYYPNGYLGFCYELTPYLKRGENILTVRLDNTKLPSARWYAGIGIYRHVSVIAVNPVHIDRFGTMVRVDGITREKARVCAVATISLPTAESRELTMTSIISDDQGRELRRSATRAIVDYRHSEISDTLIVANPRLWSPESPACYTLCTQIEQEGKVVDRYSTRFGVRKIEFTKGKGFFLNGENIKIKGVCLHQNIGAVGTALTDEMWEKRLMRLKRMGCNAVRTSHYPYSPVFYNLCDSLGLMVLDEPWDGWFNWYGCHKATYDYSYYFLDWWEKDLTDFIKRDRNHPSVIMWSLGNEVWGYDHHLYLQYKMNKMYHDMDPTRPTTQAYCTDGYPDIAGFNANGECRGDLSEFHAKDSLRLALGTEIPHTRQTRGVYRTRAAYKPWDSNEQLSPKDSTRVFPLTSYTSTEIFKGINPRYASSYDNQTRRISVREQWKQTRDNDFFIGQFVWTGEDYLGESWGWPGRTNNYGLIDLAGFEKDAYYLYQSLWSKKPMIHILPHWSHQGMEGTVIPVVAYTNGDAAELFLNGKSLGRKQMNRDSMEIVWNVPYKAGTLKAVAYRGKTKIATTSCATAGHPAALRLTADRQMMRANRRDVVFITVDVIDSKGNFVPDEDVPVTFSISGGYRLIGVENGDLLDTSPHKAMERTTFKGKASLILQATDESGALCVEAASQGLKPGLLNVKVVK